MSAWLLGQAGSPLIPPTWLSGLPWKGKVHWTGIPPWSLVPSEDLASGSFGGRGQRGDVVLEATATEIGRRRSALADADGWLCQPLELPSASSTEPLQRLPLLRQTWNRLNSIGINPSDPVGKLERLSRGELVDGAGWLALLDLEIAVVCWLPWAIKSGGDMWACSSLEEAALTFVEGLVSHDGRGLSARPWAVAICRHLGWGTGTRISLRDAGKLISYSGQGVSNVLDRLQKVAGPRVWPLAPHHVSDILGLSSLDDRSWPPASLASFAEWTGHDQVVQQLAARARAAEQQATQHSHHLDVLRAHRNELGFIDLSYVARQTGSGIAELCSALTMHYSLSAVSGSWALVGTVGRPPTAVSVAEKQFSILSPLKSGELFEGLERYRRQRSGTPNPPLTTAIELLKDVGAVTGVKGDLVFGSGEPPDPRSFDAWVIALLRHAPGGLLHRDDFIHAAVQGRKSLATTVAWLSYSPVVRPAGKGTYRLVGAVPQGGVAEAVSLAAKARRAPSRVDVRSAGGGAYQVGLLLGVGVLGSGVVTAPSWLAAAWPSTKPLVRCHCGELRGRIGLSESNSLIGWSSFLDHAVLKHGARVGDVLQFIFDQREFQALP